MFYTIYKTTNKINGKIYIGKHQTKDLNDGYLGSGKYLKKAIEKHGIKNFEKEILFIFDNEDEMNAKEAELVTEEFVIKDTNYNLCSGGQGGFGYLNKEYWTKEKRLEHNTKHSGFKNLSYSERSEYGKLGALSRAQRITSGELIPHSAWNKGKNLSEDHKLRIGKANKISQLGEANSQFGKKFRWMNNGNNNKKIPHDKVEQFISEGWVFGVSPRPNKTRG